VSASGKLFEYNPNIDKQHVTQLRLATILACVYSAAGVKMHEQAVLVVDNSNHLFIPTAHLAGAELLSGRSFSYAME
jgi:hypothetical protein